MCSVSKDMDCCVQVKEGSQASSFIYYTKLASYTVYVAMLLFDSVIIKNTAISEISGSTVAINNVSFKVVVCDLKFKYSIIE